MRLPGRDEALGILWGAGCSNGVVAHCERVTEVALRIAGELAGAGCEVDLELVEVGALLHDLGRSRTHGVDHGVAGGKIARELGMPEAVARIVERHIGAGLPEEEAVELGLPRGSFIPETLEEKIVTYADKLIEGRREVGFEVTLGKFEEELGMGHPSLERLRALHEEMAGLLGGA